MIGFYSYTVVLTYMSLISSLTGMMLTVTGHFKLALVCLALSGLLDMFDGKVARTKKNRTDDEKNFGIQIDSLCDVVCFGAFPVLLAYCIGMRGPLGIAILLCYGMAGMIRLGYYNVMEMRRQTETDENRKYYSGLPITSISIILPLAFAIGGRFNNFILLLHCTMLITGLLFIVNFKMPKPKNITLGFIVVVVAIALLKVFHVF